jgi:hypothetical protein
MSANLRRYRAIRDAFTQWYAGQPTGTAARHLTTLAALISGIVGSKSTQLPSVATKIPDGAKPESRVKGLTRWLDNAHILEEGYFWWCPSIAWMKYAQPTHARCTLLMHGTRSTSGVRYAVRHPSLSLGDGVLRCVR